MLRASRLKLLTAGVALTLATCLGTPTADALTVPGGGPRVLVPAVLYEASDYVAVAEVERVLPFLLSSRLGVLRGLELRILFYLGEPHTQPVEELEPDRAPAELHPTGPATVQVAVPLLMQNDLRPLEVGALAGRTVLVFLKQQPDGLYLASHRVGQAARRPNQLAAVFPLRENFRGWWVEDFQSAERGWLALFDLEPESVQAMLEFYPDTGGELMGVSSVPITVTTRTGFIHGRHWLAPNPAAEPLPLPPDRTLPYAGLAVLLAAGLLAWRRR